MTDRIDNYIQFSYKANGDAAETVDAQAIRVSKSRGAP
jgi:hypothetical protein